MAEVVLEKLSKTYGGVMAVDGLDLQIRDGELLVLVGPSCCGSTDHAAAHRGPGRSEGRLARSASAAARSRGSLRRICYVADGVPVFHSATAS